MKAVRCPFVNINRMQVLRLSILRYLYFADYHEILLGRGNLCINVRISDVNCEVMDIDNIIDMITYTLQYSSD